MIAFDGSSVWNRAAFTPETGVTARKTQTWSFDDAGNWSSTVLDGTTQNRTHNVKDQITNFAGNATTHDVRGNLLTFEHNSKDYEIEYDVENRMTKVEVDTQDVEYRYDAFGRRTIRKEGSDEIALLWWGSSECAEVEHGAGQPTVQNDIFCSRSSRAMLKTSLLLRKDRKSVHCDPNRLNAVIARAVDGSKFKLEWYHKNYLDHVYAVSDDTGDLIEHYRYTAYGEQEVYNQSGNLIAASAIGNEINWNTRRIDTLSGFYMYKYRTYLTHLARWGSRDPIEEWGGINLYQFVDNNSLMYRDYLGLAKCCCAEDIVVEPGDGREVPEGVDPMFGKDGEFNFGDEFGHTFQVKYKRSFHTAKTEQPCKLGWSEKTNIVPPDAKPHMKPNEWFNRFDPRYQRPVWPKDKWLSDDTEVDDFDRPSIAKLKGDRMRKLEISISLASGGPKSMCKYKKITVAITQILEIKEGEVTKHSIKYGKPKYIPF